MKTGKLLGIGIIVVLLGVGCYFLFSKATISHSTGTISGSYNSRDMASSTIRTISGFYKSRGIAISPTGTYAYISAAGSNGYQIDIIDTNTGDIKGAINGFNSPDHVEDARLLRALEVYYRKGEVNTNLISPE